MNRLLKWSFIVGVIALTACKQSDQKAIMEVPLRTGPTNVVKDTLGSILETEELSGVILIHDLRHNKSYSNDFALCDQGHLPASTFKIANTIIGLETGVIADENVVFKWDGQERAMPIWEEDLTLRDAFQLSCVPCYQELARKIGADRMQSKIDQLQYGNIKVTKENIDMFWLQGEAKISASEQIDFLKRLQSGLLKISGRTSNIIKKVMLRDSTDGYKIYAKTGLSTTNDEYNAWYVGYIEKKDDTYFFATNVEPQSAIPFRELISKRITVVNLAFQTLGIVSFTEREK